MSGPELVEEAAEDLDSTQSKSWLTIWKVLAFSVGLCFLLCGGLFAAFVLPSIGRARLAAETVSACNNLKRIGHAFYEYHSANGALPLPYLSNDDDPVRQLASWRVAITPYLEVPPQGFEWDETQSWDSEVNRSFQDFCPLDFQKVIGQRDRPETPETSIFVVRHPDGVMSGDHPIGLKDVTDGRESTLLAVSIPSLSAVWTMPQEINLQQLQAAFQSAAYNRPVFVLFCDGDVAFFKEPVEPSVVVSMVTMAKDD